MMFPGNATYVAPVAAVYPAYSGGYTETSVTRSYFPGTYSNFVRPFASFY
jgi:hypothetical protein